MDEGPEGLPSMWTPMCSLFLGCSMNTFPQLEPLCQVQLSCPWVEALMEPLGMGALRRYIIYMGMSQKMSLESIGFHMKYAICLIQNCHSLGFHAFRKSKCVWFQQWLNITRKGLLTSPYFLSGRFFHSWSRGSFDILRSRAGAIVIPSKTTLHSEGVAGMWNEIRWRRYLDWRDW